MSCTLARMPLLRKYKSRIVVSLGHFIQTNKPGLAAMSLTASKDTDVVVVGARAISVRNSQTR
jgi:hypothetical protein